MSEGLTAQCLNGLVRAGDRAKVVMPVPCCGDRGGIGEEWVVAEIVENASVRCPVCSAIYKLGRAIVVSENEMGTVCGGGAEVIRIDPPADGEVSELELFSRADTTAMKQFLATINDRFREIMVAALGAPRSKPGPALYSEDLY